MFVLEIQQPDHTVKSGRALPIPLRMQLAELLVQCKDIFPWSSVDLGMVPRFIAEHKLGIPSCTKLTFKKKEFLLKQDKKS